MSSDSNGIAKNAESQQESKVATESLNTRTDVDPERGDVNVKESTEKEAAARSLHEGDETDLEKIALDDSLWAKYPGNPHNWSVGKKWQMTGVVSAYTFFSPLASSMLAPGLPSVAIKYHITNPTVVALVLSIYILAFCLGPLVMSPLSEMYGRRWVLHVSNAFFIIFNFVCAFAPNTAALIIFRFLAGLGGATPVAIGGGAIADVFTPNERAAAMAVFSVGPLLGPVIGPIAGGFVAQEIGFKWVFIIISCTSLLTMIIGIPVLVETYHPVLRARMVLEATGDKQKAQNLLQGAYQGMTKGQFLWVNLSRPMALLWQSFILNILSLFMALQFGLLYLMFTTFPVVFTRTYGFSTGLSGLAYLGLGVGFMLATVFGATTANAVYLKLVERNKGVAKPEYRIPAVLIGSFLIPVGLFWYGWSSHARIHWIMPIIGSGIFAAGMMTTFLPLTLYIVDTFKYAASALAAASVVRSLLGFVFPLFAYQMFEALGNGPGYSLLAGIAIVLGVPFPIWIYFYGERVRARSDVNR